MLVRKISQYIITTELNLALRALPHTPNRDFAALKLINSQEPIGDLNTVPFIRIIEVCISSIHHWSVSILTSL